MKLEVVQTSSSDAVYGHNTGRGRTGDGDSGTCVDKDGKFVGLAFATNQGDIYALVCKASYIISGLGISVGP